MNAAWVSEARNQLATVGYAKVPGPYSQDQLGNVIAAYDQIMATAEAATGFRVGSSTTRMSDLLNHSEAFDYLLSYEPLVQLATEFIGEPVKLSSFLGRTLRSQRPAQELHSDLPRDSADAPLFGFIVMLDPFREENGATRFIPGSHKWSQIPSEALVDVRAKHPEEVYCCGSAGEIAVFDASVWHGHSANQTESPRRSIQGYFVRRSARAGCDFSQQLLLETQRRFNATARDLLALGD